MADNATIQSNVDTSTIVVGADLISGVLYQRHKLIHGDDGVNAGDVSLANGLPIQPATSSVFPTTQTPLTSGGLTPFKLVSASNTNGTNVKASAGQIYGIQVFNTNAAARYLKIYNKASAPTVGSNTPVKTIFIPAGGGVILNQPLGIAFATGISIALTTGLADSDTGAVASGEIVVNIDYK